MSVCMSVCLSACLSVGSHIFKKTRPNFRKVSVYILLVAVARSFYDDNAIRYVLPALWMTSCLPTMGHIPYTVARG